MDLSIKEVRIAKAPMVEWIFLHEPRREHTPQLALSDLEPENAAFFSTSRQRAALAEALIAIVDSCWVASSKRERKLAPIDKSKLFKARYKKR